MVYAPEIPPAANQQCEYQVMVGHGIYKCMTKQEYNSYAASHGLMLMIMTAVFLLIVIYYIWWLIKSE